MKNIILSKLYYDLEFLNLPSTFEFLDSNLFRYCEMAHPYSRKDDLISSVKLVINLVENDDLTTINILTDYLNLANNFCVTNSRSGVELGKYADLSEACFIAEREDINHNSLVSVITQQSY